LYDIWAIEFTDPLWYSFTVFSIIPVTGGRRKPPKKSKSHIRAQNIWKFSTNGAGIEAIIHPKPA